MLTDTEKAALVERLAEAIQNEYESGGDAREIATACLPLITDLLAERDVDALLDSVGAHYLDVSPLAGSQCKATILIGRLPVQGTGSTRLAAVQDAVKAAKEAHGEGDTNAD